MKLATLRRDRLDGALIDMGQSLYIDRSQISLEREIKRGRFAIIYLAKLRGTSQELHTVAAKVLLGMCKMPYLKSEIERQNK